MDETPPFLHQQRSGAVTVGDVIVVGGTGVKATSLYGLPVSELPRYSADAVHLTGQKAAQVWGIDDKGEAILAEWEDGQWIAKFR